MWNDKCGSYSGGIPFTNICDFIFLLIMILWLESTKWLKNDLHGGMKFVMNKEPWISLPQISFPPPLFSIKTGH